MFGLELCRIKMVDLKKSDDMRTLLMLVDKLAGDRPHKKSK